MLAVAFDILLLFLIFSLIGLGPTLLMSNAQNIQRNICVMSPSMGIVLTTLIGTYLVIFDMPIKDWAFNWLMLGLFSSLSLSFVVLKKQFAALTMQDLVKFDKSFGYFWLGFLLLYAILIIPLLSAGLDFTVLRGNTADNFNYMSLAGYLINEPYSWLSTATLQELIDKHPSYVLAKELSSVRWSVSMLMGWCTVLTNIPLYKIEYGFSLIFYLPLYCAAYWYAQLLKLRPLAAMLAALVICVGFWGQFVLDIRALSHVSVLPLILAFTYLFNEIEENSTKVSWFSYIILGLIFTAITYLYIEMLALLVLGLFIFFVLQIINKRFVFSHFARYLVSIVTVIGLTLPVYQWLIKFFFYNQLNYALYVPNGGWVSSFNWLYKDRLMSFWWGSFIGDSVVMNGVLFVLGLILFLTLFFILARKTLHRKSSSLVALDICIALTWTTIIAFLYLFSKQQLWPAAKMLSYGYPYFILLTLFILSQYENEMNRARIYRILKTIAKSTVVLWLVFQLFLGGYRVAVAKNDDIYQNHRISFKGYRVYDWDLNDIQAFLKNKQADSVGVLVNNIWLREYIGFVLGWDLPTLYLDGILKRSESFLGMQSYTTLPKYIILEKDNLENGSVQRVAENNSLLLAQTNENNDLILISKIMNPNGIEAWSGKRGFWLDNRETQINFFAFRDGIAIVTAQYGVGPSGPNDPIRHLLVSAKNDAQQTILINKKEPIAFTIPVQKGSNSITLKSLDEALPQKEELIDKRTLLIAVYDLKISYQDQG